MKKNKSDPLDHTIAQRIQALEQEVPQKLELAFMEALQKIEPIDPLVQDMGQKQHWLQQGSLLAAATVILAVMLIGYMVFQFFNPSPALVVQADEVWVQDSYVENEPATTFVVNPNDANITIVWVEKIKK